MTVAVTEPSVFASKWLSFQTTTRHATNVKKCAKMIALRDWTQIAVFIKYKEVELISLLFVFYVVA